MYAESALLEEISSDDELAEEIQNTRTHSYKILDVGACDLICCPPPPPPPQILSKSYKRQKNDLHVKIDAIKRKKANEKPTQAVSNNHEKNTADWTDEDLLDNSDGDGKQGTNTLHQQIGDSFFWTQSIAPSKYYTRTRTGQKATPALHALQQQFANNVLGTIQYGRESQPCSEPTIANFNACSNANCSHSHLYCTSSDESESNDKSSSSSLEELSENGESNNAPNMDNFDEFRGEGSARGNKHGRKRRRRNKKGQMRWQRHTNTIAQTEIQRKRTHPASLHPDIGFNEPGQLNDGPECKCSWAARQIGVRHGKFEGELPVPRCDWNSSNTDSLYHYVLHVQPNPGKFSRRPTEIYFDGHSYQFDGFSIFFHRPLPEHFPQQSINQWSQHFQVHFVRENTPESFTIHDLELFHSYMFDYIMELYDLNRQLNLKGLSESSDQYCYFYHCLPRFARHLPENGKELLPMSSILAYFLNAFGPLMNMKQVQYFSSNHSAFLNFAHSRKGQICINPTKKPHAIRVDLLDFDSNPRLKLNNNHNGYFDVYPLITHFGVKPSAYAFLKKPQLREAIAKNIHLRKQFAQKKVLNLEERRQLYESETNLKALKIECKSKRDITVRFSSNGFYQTKIYPDMIQHALLLVLACQHVRLHCSLEVLERERLGYTFKNRALLELSLIHPSFRTNYGTNPDHVKNVLNNCGLRMTKMTKIGKFPYNDKMPTAAITSNAIAFNEQRKGNQDRQQQKLELIQQTGRRRGIQVLLEIMALQGCKRPTDTDHLLVRHNERLEFLGDAVVEFLTTVHLFYLFTELDEGGLATFRSALVQNRHLASMADHLGLQNFMVYAHGPDLCHEADLRHAMANAFEALMAAVFLDADLEQCDRIFGNALFKEEPLLLEIWNRLPEHPLKRGNPYGDRHLIESVPCLKLLSEFEQCIGIRFKHIRLLAKAFTRRNVPFNFLTLGHNQRLEFLGDTVLQLITSEYLYKHFPYHQEGHLSLLRTCLVSNKTQSVVCDDLAMGRYLIIPPAMLRKSQPQSQLRLKDKADLVESFLGALYVDRGLYYCRRFCQVCFFPRLKHFIITQQWNDPKSQLQQCCLTLRKSKVGTDPDIPEYKTIAVEGPTNTRVYRVAVYFRNKRLAIGTGSSVHLAQMHAAESALVEHARLFANCSAQGRR